MQLHMAGLTKANDCKSLDEIRQHIDLLDEYIIKAMGLRFTYVKEVVKYKSKDIDSIRAQNRYDKVISNRRKLAAQNGLDPDVIEKIYRQLLDYFINEELKITDLKNK